MPIPQLRMLLTTAALLGVSPGALVLGAFEPQEEGPLLRLELISNFPVPAVVTAPRVMVGQRVGGVATEFVQGY